MDINRPLIVTLLGPKIYDQDTYTWNRHRESQNTQNWFWYETFYYLFEFKVFRHEERETQFLSMLTFPSGPHHVWPPPQTTGLALASSKNRLACSEFKSQLTAFFQISKSSAPLPGMTSFTSPVTFPIWGFYCDISDCHICPAHKWTPALSVCT